MPISVKCPHCNRSHQVKKEWRGKSAKCGCGKSFAIPDESSGQPSDSSAVDDLLQGVQLSGPVNLPFKQPAVPAKKPKKKGKRKTGGASTSKSAIKTLKVVAGVIEATSAKPHRKATQRPVSQALTPGKGIVDTISPALWCRLQELGRG